MKRNKVLQDFVDLFARESFGRDTKSAGCVFCGSEKIKREDFRDGLSWKEFGISHICQKCQDETFGEE